MDYVREEFVADFCADVFSFEEMLVEAGLFYVAGFLFEEIF